MKNFFLSLKIFFVFACVSPIIFTSGCKENALETNGSVISTRDELTDPNVTPEVIWTFPAHNSTGPFTAYNNTSTQYFIIQFNKLMNLNTFTTSSIKIKGFDTRVVITLYDYYSNSQSSQNVLKFYIRNYATGNSMNFEIGKTYEVNIDSTIEDIHGKHLKNKYSFSFTPEPSFRVRSAAPANGDTLDYTNYNNTSNMYLLFNSPISTSNLSSIHISPAVAGKWTIDQNYPSNIYFLPTIGFDFSTTYQIFTDQNFTDRDGHTLSQPFSSAFYTSPFKVLTTSPANDAQNISTGYSGYNIYVALSGQLDATTAASAFSISPAIQGNVSVSGNQLSFYTTEPFTPSTKYTVTIGTQLKAKNGTVLSSPYIFSFTTEDFRVTNTEPYQGSSSVSSNAQITFYFNSPINPASVVSAFSIKPAVAGNFSFIYNDNRSFTFIPSQPLKLGTSYTATLSTAMKSFGGANLKDSYEIQFTTLPFQVSSTSPSNGSYNTTANNIAVWFTANVDTGSIRNSFTVSPATAGNFSFSTNQFYFYPTTSFAAGKKYTVTLSTGVKSTDGTSLQSPYTFSFNTQPFQITSFSPSIGSTEVNRYSSVYVYTNYNVDQTSVTSAFSISPSVAGNLYSNSNGFYFAPQSQLAANTLYTFTVSTKLKSTKGDTLLVGQSSTFKTGN